ncbi:hypothetical protein Tco_1316136 [Tanacetum coccineum]
MLGTILEYLRYDVCRWSKGAIVVQDKVHGLKEDLVMVFGQGNMVSAIQKRINVSTDLSAIQNRNDSTDGKSFSNSKYSQWCLGVLDRYSHSNCLRSSGNGANSPEKVSN